MMILVTPMMMMIIMRMRMDMKMRMRMNMRMRMRVALRNSTRTFMLQILYSKSPDLQCLNIITKLLYKFHVT